MDPAIQRINYHRDDGYAVGKSAGLLKFPVETRREGVLLDDPGGLGNAPDGSRVFISFGDGYQRACRSAAATAIEMPCVSPPVGCCFRGKLKAGGVALWSW